MSGLIIYIIDGASFETHDIVEDGNGEHIGTSETFKNVLNIESIEQIVGEIIQSADLDENSQIEVHLVDQNYKISYFYTEEGKKYYNIIHGIQRDYNNFVTFHDIPWSTYRDGLSIDKNILYYFVSAKKDFANIYHFYQYLGIKIQDNIFVRYGVEKLSDIMDSVVPYNIFGTTPKIKETNAFGEPVFVDDDAIDFMLRDGIEHVKQLKQGGVSDEEPFVSNMACWALNTESFFMNGVIREFELYPKRRILPSDRDTMIGKTVQEKFNESARYRYQIYNCMVRILCKYGENHGKLSNIVNPHTVNLDMIL